MTNKESTIHDLYTRDVQAIAGLTNAAVSVAPLRRYWDPASTEAWCKFLSKPPHIPFLLGVGGAFAGAQAGFEAVLWQSTVGAAAMAEALTPLLLTATVLGGAALSLEGFCVGFEIGKSDPWIIPGFPPLPTRGKHQQPL